MRFHFITMSWALLFFCLGPRHTVLQGVLFNRAAYKESAQINRFQWTPCRIDPRKCPRALANWVRTELGILVHRQMEVLRANLGMHQAWKYQRTTE